MNANAFRGMSCLTRHTAACSLDFLGGWEGLVSFLPSSNCTLFSHGILKSIWS